MEGAPASQGLPGGGLPLMADRPYRGGGSNVAKLAPSSDPESNTMVLNMGPQHPSTHGLLRLEVEIHGENVIRMLPDIGFLHTGIDKTCQAKYYQHVVPLTD